MVEKLLATVCERAGVDGMKSLEKVLTQGPSGLVFASTIGGHAALGYRDYLDLSQPVPMTFDSSFDLASITKIMCTTAIMMDLTALGEISLQDKVEKFLPAWNGEKSTITVKHLLRHRSGLAPWRPMYVRKKSREEVYDFIATEPLANPVDSVRVYSDLGFITLGQIISVITGKRLEDAFEEIVRKPYGLSHTQFSKPVTEVVSTARGDHFEKVMVETNTPYQVPELADEFARWRTHILKGEVSDGNSFHIFGGIAGHAGLFSTAEDLISFGEEISQHELFTTFTGEGPDPDAHLGFVSWSDTVGNCTDRFFGHTGFTGGAFGISHAHGVVATLLTNRTHVDTPLTPTANLWTPVVHELHAHLHAH